MRFRWWVSRFRGARRFADIVRIDHFRGFAAYWEIPASERTAIHGRWVPGPGRALFDALRDAMGELPLVAEGPRPHHAGSACAPQGHRRSRHEGPAVCIRAA